MVKKTKLDDKLTVASINALLATYRDSNLTTPVVLWKTAGSSVSVWELSQEEYDKLKALFGR